MPARFARTVAAELADPLTPILGTGAAATAMLGESTDAVLVGSVTIGNALISGVQRLRAETALESLLLEQDVTVHREPTAVARTSRQRAAPRATSCWWRRATWWPRTPGCWRRPTSRWTSPT